jgi:hypothetical protein
MRLMLCSLGAAAVLVFAASTFAAQAYPGGRLAGPHTEPGQTLVRSRGGTCFNRCMEKSCTHAKNRGKCCIRRCG